MDKTNRRDSFPIFFNDSSSTSTDDIVRVESSDDDTQDRATVSNDRGGHFWQRSLSQPKRQQRAHAEETLQALGVPSAFMEHTLNALPLGKFEKLFRGDPPPLRIIYRPDKTATLSWSNSALSASTLDAIVDVCHALSKASTVLLAETFAEGLLDIAMQAPIPADARAKLLKWCSRFMVSRSVIDLPPQRSLSLMFECKNLFAKGQLPKREYFQILNRLVGVSDAEGYAQLSLKPQVKLITQLINAWADRTTKPADTGWRKRRREELARHVEILHTRALDEKDELSAQRTLVLLQSLHRKGNDAGILGTFKGIVGQAGEWRADTKFRNKGRAVERCLVIIGSDDGDFVAKPVPGGPPLEPKRLLNYLVLSTQSPSRLLSIDMAPYIVYGRQHFKHVFTPDVVCRLWLAHAHINPQERRHILMGILATGGVPLGKAFEDLAKWYADEFNASIAQALIAILGDERAGQHSLVTQISILRAIVEINQIVGLSGPSLKLGSGKSSPNPLPLFCTAFHISDSMAVQLQSMLRIMRNAVDQHQAEAFEHWISISTHGQKLFHDDDRWPPLHAQLTHAMLVHALARGDIEDIYPALMRLARNGLLPGKRVSAHALVARFLAEALADEELDAAKLTTWAELQVHIDRLVLKLFPGDRHEAHMTLGAVHAAMSLATGSDSRCGESEIAEVYKHLFLFEIHAADGGHHAAVHHLESAVDTYISGGKYWGARAAEYAAAAASIETEAAQHIVDFCNSAEHPGFMFDPDRRLIKALRHSLGAIAALPLDEEDIQDRVARLLRYELD